MPHLRYNGRLWKVGGDELSPVSVVASSLRLLWSAFLIAILFLSFDRLAECSAGWIIIFYILASLVVFLVTIVVEICILRISLRGSMVDTPSRSGLGYYLSWHIALGLLQLLLAIVGFCVIQLTEFPCSSEFHTKADILFLSVVVISQLIDVLGLLCCCYIFSHKKSRSVDIDPQYKEFDQSLEIWKARCSYLCKGAQYCTCNLFGGGNITEDLETVARVLTTFFHHEGFLDVVASDVVAGIVLVRLQQRALENSYTSSYNTSGQTSSSNDLGNRRNPLITRSISLSPSVSGGLLSDEENLLSPRLSVRGGEILDPSLIRELRNSSPLDVEIVENLSHYAPYFLAVYTTYLLLYMKPCTGWCLMGNECMATNEGCCCSCLKQREFTVEGDNCCSTHHAAMMAVVRKNQAHLIYTSLENRSYPPFAIFCDVSKRAVVISVRGTMSLEDCVRDIDIQPVEMITAGEKYGFDGRGRYAHGGMLDAAMAIREFLRTSTALSDAYTLLGKMSCPSSDHSGNLYTSIDQIHTPLNGANQHNDVNLVLVGHSLGAGIAAILAKLMRATYPDLKCYGYGIPGAVMDTVTSNECNEYVFNLSHHNDIVPSLSLYSLSNLRHNILDAICRAKVNKMVIMQGVFKEYVTRLDDLMYAPGEEPDNNFSRSVKDFNAKMAKQAEDLHRVPLTIPGRNFHMKKIMKGSYLCNKRSQYKMYECPNSFYSTIKVAPSMFFDHFPNHYAEDIQHVAEDFVSFLAE